MRSGPKAADGSGRNRCDTWDDGGGRRLCARLLPYLQSETAKSKIENTIARVAKLADAPDLGFRVIPSVGKAYSDITQHHVTKSINVLSS